VISVIIYESILITMEKLFLFIYVTLAFSCLDLVPQIQAFFPEFVVAGLKLSLRSI
jgi:hypothetical protein